MLQRGGGIVQLLSQNSGCMSVKGGFLGLGDRAANEGGQQFQHGGVLPVDEQ